MPCDSFAERLEGLEGQFKTLSAQLVAGQPEQLTLACTKFQQLAVDLLRLSDPVGRAHMRNPAVVHRIRVLGAGLSNLRENLMRQSAYVDQALALVVPQTVQKATYPGIRTYGGPVRQSGAFSVLSV